MGWRSAKTTEKLVDYANTTNDEFIVDLWVLFYGWLIYGYLHQSWSIDCQGSVQIGSLTTFTRKNNRFSLLDILGYLKKNPWKSQIWQIETSPNQGIPNKVPCLGLVSLFQIWDFCRYSLNTLKYPKMGICYFFVWLEHDHIAFIADWYSSCHPAEKQHFD